jgi:hypothetical protein
VRPVVALDAALLAIPNSASTGNEAETILGRVVDWSAYLESDSAIRIAQLSGTADTLADLNFFPNPADIDALLTMFALKHVYTVEDIRYSISVILDRAPYFCDLLGSEVRRVSFCAAEPDVLNDYDAGLRPAGERILSSTACASLIHSEELGDILFAALGSRKSDARSVNVHCDIDELVSHFKLTNLYLPVGTSGTVQVAWSPEDVLTRLSPEAIWKRADDCLDIHLAINLEALAIKRSMTPGALPNMVPGFYIGSEFYASLLRNAAGPGGVLADTVRETCARLILGNAKYAVKPLLKGRKTKIRQDGAVAFRTHVTKHHAGIRLMFWKRTDNVFELANVGPKNELTIEEGVSQGLVRRSW